MSEPAERVLRALLSSEPRTLSAFEAISGPLGADPNGADWFHVSFPRSYREQRLFSDALGRIGLTFSPFREAGDPPLESYRITVLLPLQRALAIATEVRGEPVRGSVEGSATQQFGAFHLRTHNENVLLDWTTATDEPIAPFDPAMRASYLVHLPQLLARATSATQLDRATAPAPPTGIRRQADAYTPPAQSWPAHFPRVRLAFDPPIDARELAATWALERPIAVSTDVHQGSWWIALAGERLADPHGVRIASRRIELGIWELRPRLDKRPAGPLPGVSCGASPAYDVMERGGQVVSLEIVPTVAR